MPLLYSRFWLCIPPLTFLVVDGSRIRKDPARVDFTMGGNPAVYDWVSPGTIILDGALSLADRIPTAMHEVYEYHLMLHEGMDYERAHDLANCCAEIPARLSGATLADLRWLVDECFGFWL